MTELWWEIRLKVPAAALELLGNELSELGCAGVTVEERQLDTFVPPDPNEALAGDYQVKAYFPQQGQGELLAAAIRDRLLWLSGLFPELPTQLPELYEVRNEDWAEGWKQHFSAVRIGRQLVIKPSWEAFAAAPDDVVVDLDPGMAFGTGTHGTTRLCLEAVAELCAERVPRRVLDVGTGSGILAIAAAALGAGTVLACDIDADAVRIAGENAAQNGVLDRIELTTAPLEVLPGDFDLVLANILAEENIRLGAELVKRLAPGGVLVLSGILIEKEELVVSAFAAFPLTPVHITRRDEWSCLLFRKIP